MANRILIFLYAIRLLEQFGYCSLKSQINFKDHEISDAAANIFLGMDLSQMKEHQGSFERLSIPGSNKSIDEYLCFIPEGQNDTLNTLDYLLVDLIVNEPELVSQALDIIQQSFDRKNCVFMYGAGDSYWTYAYCYMDKVIQFHCDMQHLIKTKQHRPMLPDHVYVLGRFRGALSNSATIRNEASLLKNSLTTRDFNIFEHSSEDVSPLQQSIKSQMVIQHTITNGEMCSYIGKTRTIDIIYICDPAKKGLPSITDVEELLTCRYQITISVPNLCKLPEFFPRLFQEEVVNIDCTRISMRGNCSSVGLPKGASDFFLHSLTLVSDFPMGQEFRINLFDFSSFPFGFGLYQVFEKSLKTPTSDWLQRLRFVYTKPFSSIRELTTELDKIFRWTLTRMMPSPIMPKLGVVESFSWKDSYVAWFEIYDYSGKYVTLIRVHRDHSIPVGLLDVKAVNRLNMTDQDGNIVKIGKFEATGGIWNYEWFRSGREEAKSKSKRINDKSPQSHEEHIKSDADRIELQNLASKLGFESNDKVFKVLNILVDKMNDSDFTGTDTTNFVKGSTSNTINPTSTSKFSTTLDDSNTQLHSKVSLQTFESIESDSLLSKNEASVSLINMESVPSDTLIQSEYISDLVEEAIDAKNKDSSVTSQATQSAQYSIKPDLSNYKAPASNHDEL